MEVFDFYRKEFKRIPSPLISISFSNPYRQGSQLDPIYESGWNRKSGWLKLVHVCRKWRRIVLASPSRLDLSFDMTARNPGHMKTIFSPRLPPIPIRIDYVHGAQTYNDLCRVVTALKHRNRVRGIVFKGPDAHLGKLFKAMKSSPFPVLERLEICHSYLGSHLKLPPRVSAPNLRRLELCTVSFVSISQLLSSATALVDLSLQMDSIFGPSLTVSLVAYLQAMPCLACLSLTLSDRSPRAKIQVPSLKGETIVPLPKLTFFHFRGHRAFLDVLLAGLAAPALQAFDIELRDDDMSPLCQLGRFITEIEAEYYACRVPSFCSWSLQPLFCLYLATRSERTYILEPQFKFYSKDIIQIGNALAPKLAVVEELFLDSVDKNTSTPWHRLLELFRGVKILSVHYDIALDVAHSLQQEHGESAVVLPSLDEIKLRLEFSYDGEDERRSRLAAFEPIAAAREQGGRSVKVSCVDWRLKELSEFAFMVRCDLSSLKSPGF